MNQPESVQACLSDDQLCQIVEEDDTLDPQSAAHLDTCGDCKTRLAELTDSATLAPYHRVANSQRFQVSYFGLESSQGNGEPVSSFGRYQVDSVIGSGGMGTVYKVQDGQLGRMVALKVLKHADNDTALARFEREAKSLSRLSHPHVVPVFTSGKSPDGRPYLVMPLVEGRSLKNVLQQAPMDAREAAKLICEIASGLNAAHESGLIHRDVKPANILLDSSDNKAKLVDFGLVRGVSDETLTRADVICGTPDYMSPEQANHFDKADARSDVYSLGITLYECLTGIPPFRGGPIRVIEQHRTAEPVRPARLNPGVPHDLETICLKAIAKEPSRRYETAQLFSDDLTRFLAGQPIHARETTRWERLGMWCRRNRRLAALIATSFGLLLTLCIGSTVAAWRLNAANRSVIKEKQNAVEAKRLAVNDRSAAIASLSSLVDSLFDELTTDAARIKTREKVISAAIDGLKSISKVSGDREADRAAQQAYLRIGELMSLRGASQKAQENYAQAISLARNMLERNPADLQAKRDLAMALGRLGTHYTRLQNSHAAELGDESMALLAQVLDSDPDDVIALAQLAEHHNQTLNNIWQRRKPTEVIKYGESARHDVARLFEQPNPSARACLVAQEFYFCLGRAYLESSNAAKAAEHFAAARGYLDKKLERSPDHVSFKSAAAVVDRSQAMVLVSLGRPDEATAKFENALSTLRQMSAADPDDIGLKQNVANTQNLMSEALIVSNRVEEALDLLNHTVEMYQQVLLASPDNDSARLLICDTRFKAADAMMRVHRWKDAHEVYIMIQQELKTHEFGEAAESGVQFFNAVTEFAREATARLRGEATDSKTSTGEFIALAYAARRDAESSTSDSLSPETKALISGIDSAFTGTTFDELFTYLQVLNDVFPAFGAELKSFEARVHGLLARNHAESDLPNAAKLSSESLDRCLSVIRETASVKPSFRDTVLKELDLKWVRQTPAFQKVWSNMGPAGGR